MGKAKKVEKASKKREYPEGIYSVRDARAHFKDIIEDIAKGRTVVILNSTHAAVEVKAVLGSVALPERVRRWIEEGASSRVKESSIADPGDFEMGEIDHKEWNEAEKVKPAREYRREEREEKARFVPDGPDGSDRIMSRGIARIAEDSLIKKAKPVRGERVTELDAVGPSVASGRGKASVERVLAPMGGGMSSRPLERKNAKPLLKPGSGRKK